MATIEIKDEIKNYMATVFKSWANRMLGKKDNSGIVWKKAGFPIIEKEARNRKTGKGGE